MIKYLRIASVSLILVFALLVVYGKSKFTNINFSINDKNQKYVLYEYEEFLLTGTEVAKVIIDDKAVTSLNDIMNGSELVLKVNTSGDRIVKGMGIINRCKVLEVYKDNGDFKEEDVLIYDYSDYLSVDFATYIEGNKPLKANEEYIVFLKKAPNPNMSNTYIYSSINFGSFLVNKTSNYLGNYENGTKNLEDTYNYDYISKNDDFLEMYKAIAEELENISTY